MGLSRAVTYSYSGCALHKDGLGLAQSKGYVFLTHTKVHQEPAAALMLGH